MQARWSLVVPVKVLSHAKTRLGGPGGFSPELRAALALAFALDTVQAALACELVDRVVVVTADQSAARDVSRLGARVVPDEAVGINDAINSGAQAAADGPVGALCGDLPALRADELTRVLQSAQRHARAVLGDRQAYGTTLLTALDPQDLRPAFGDGSLQRHVDAGATELLSTEAASVRCDVDTRADLAAARLLGLGSFTERLLHA